jgi:PAS domain S-box-containing protein
MRNPAEHRRESAERQPLDENLWAAPPKPLGRLPDSDAGLDLASTQLEQLAAIVESSEDAIIGCTLGGLITIWNRGAERLFGFSADEVLGEVSTTNCRLAWPEELKAIKRVRNGEHVPPFEAVRRRKDGHDIHVSVSVSPIRDRQGQLVGASAIVRDITERKRLEEQVRHAQKMEAVGRLAGGVAHDFNNLLTIISGCSEELLDSMAPGDSAGELVTEIHKAGERAAALVRQLLAFSRKQVVEPTLLDLNAVVRDTEKMVRRLLGGHITLTTALAPALGQVEFDVGQLEQVVVNLVVNARDAMPQGGRLTIETADVELGAGAAQAHTGARPGRYVLLAVSDTGCGMDEHVKAHLFEPFFTTKGPGKGTGLGLATVYGIVKQSGGCIEVVSAPGRGATFKVYLPAVGGPVPSGHARQEGE